VEGRGEEEAQAVFNPFHPNEENSQGSRLLKKEGRGTSGLLLTKDAVITILSSEKEGSPAILIGGGNTDRERENFFIASCPGPKEKEEKKMSAKKIPWQLQPPRG